MRSIALVAALALPLFSCAPSPGPNGALPSGRITRAELAERPTMSALEALKVLGQWTRDQILRSELWIDGLRVDSTGALLALQNIPASDVVEITRDRRT